MDRKRRCYKKCIVKGEKLAGVILIGDKADFVEYKNLIASGIELGDKKEKLLSGGNTAKPPKGAVICSCNSVGRGNIEDEFKNGVCNFESIMTTTGAGTGCGICRPEVNKIIRVMLTHSMEKE